MKERVRNAVLSLGADLCGFANTDRFGGFPEGFSPTDIYPGCKTVVSFALALPRGLARVKPLIYGHYNELSCEKVDWITLAAAKKIEEDFGCTAVPLPCDTPCEYWDAALKEARGLLSMKHAAEQAGLGSIGKNTLLINGRYGNMLTLGAILTELDLPSDAPSEALCIPGCRLCADACPVGAIANGAVTQGLCREHTYKKTAYGLQTVCNECRTVCPVSRVNYA